MRYLILDIATTPLASAGDYLESPAAPENYKDPQKIADYIAEKRAALLERAALDPDLGRIAMMGWQVIDNRPPASDLSIVACRDEQEETSALYSFSRLLTLTDEHYCALIGYNALKFDWPFLLRRAAYLGVKLTLNLDRYKTPHIDLLERLTHRGVLASKSLGFYTKRLGWTDLVKPLSGAEEARAPQAGLWAELEASVRHDVIATTRLAEWLGVLPARAA